MHIARAFWASANGKVYQSVYLRESYREGNRVRKRNIANLTHCDPQEIAAIELALQWKGNLAALGSLDKIQLTQGLSVGALWTVYETARRLGLPKILGDDFNGQAAKRCDVGLLHRNDDVCGANPGVHGDEAARVAPCAAGSGTVRAGRKSGDRRR